MKARNFLTRRLSSVSSSRGSFDVYSAYELLGRSPIRQQTGMETGLCGQELSWSLNFQAQKCRAVSFLNLFLGHHKCFCLVGGGLYASHLLRRPESDGATSNPGISSMSLDTTGASAALIVTPSIPVNDSLKWFLYNGIFSVADDRLRTLPVTVSLSVSE